MPIPTKNLLTILSSVLFVEPNIDDAENDEMQPAYLAVAGCGVCMMLPGTNAPARNGSSCLMSFRISGHCPFPCYTLTAEAWEGFRFGFGMLLRGPLHRVRDNTAERQGVASAAPYQSTVSPSSS